MHFTIEGMPASAGEVPGILAAYARCGIFSVRDMGHKSGIGLRARAMPQGRVEVRTAGFALFRKGGYGTFLGKAVEGKEEIKRAVKEVSDAGVDFIKVINSGLVSLKGPEHVTEGGFTSGELRMIAEEARGRNLDVSCHANSDKAIRDAVMAGVTSVEHGFFISEETVGIMAKKGISWTPTAFALLTLASFLGPSEKRRIEEIIDGHLRSIHLAASLGLKLRVGTDSGSRGTRHGESFFEELRLFEKAGLTLPQILSAACMDEEETAKGNFLIVKRDFVTTGAISLSEKPA